MIVRESDPYIPAKLPDASSVQFPPQAYQARIPKLAELDIRVAIRAAAMSGALAAILGALPVRGAFIFAVPVAGFIAALLYDRKVRTQLSLRTGFKLGALTGLIASVIFLVLAALEALVGHAEPELRHAMVDSIHQAQARAPDEPTRQALEYFLTPNGMLVMMILGVIFTVVIFVLVSGAGGAIFAALSSNRSRSE